MDEGWGYAILAFVVVIIVFLICRELVCWYWKINRIVELLEGLNRKLGSSSKDLTIND